MSTKIQRRYWAEHDRTTFHRVTGYGGKGACGRGWGDIIGATTRWRMVTCRGCLRDWAKRVGGIRRTRGGAWVLDGRRYRTLRLALMSTGWA